VAWVAGVLALALSLWLWVVFSEIRASVGPNGLAFDVDFAHTYAGSLILGAHGNPYNVGVLWRVEHHVLSAAGLPVEPRSPAVRVGSSPFFLLLFRPLNGLPYQTAATVWMLAAGLITTFGFLGILQYLGWKRALVPCLMFVAMPPTVLGIFYGNTIPIVFAGIGCSLPLLRRHPILAGVLLSLAMLKPPAALPFVLLVVLFLAPSKRLVVAGFVAAAVIRRVVVYVLLGPQYLWWEIKGYLGFAHSINLQPNLTSFSGLYARLVGQTPRLGLEVAGIAAACIVTAVVWWRLREQPAGPHHATIWLWFIWMAATPYAHFEDEMLLAVPVLVLLGTDARELGRPLVVAVLGLMFSSVLLFSWSPFGAQLLWVPLVAAALCSIAIARKAAGVQSASPAISLA
jgi:hypothetical protein